MQRHRVIMQTIYLKKKIYKWNYTLDYSTSGVTLIESDAVKFWLNILYKSSGNETN